MGHPGFPALINVGGADRFLEDLSPDIPRNQFFGKVVETREELLEGFWGYMIGNMIAVFFVLCQILGKLQHGQIRYMQIINFSYFVW